MCVLAKHPSDVDCPACVGSGMAQWNLGDGPDQCPSCCGRGRLDLAAVAVEQEHPCGQCFDDLPF